MANSGSAASTLARARPKPKLLQSRRANLRLRQFSPRTEDAYTAWTRRFVRFHKVRHPVGLSETELKAFLVHLAQDRHLAPSTLCPGAQVSAGRGAPFIGSGSFPRRVRTRIRRPLDGTVTTCMSPSFSAPWRMPCGAVGLPNGRRVTNYRIRSPRIC